MARRRQKTRNPKRLVASFIVFGLTGVILLLARVLTSDSSRYLFLLWNLVLASLAPLIAWWLVARIKNEGWLRLPQILLSVLWLLVLPNSFYIVTDFIHLRPTYEASVLFDAVMLTMFTLSGMMLGYLSVVLVHRELKRRVSPKVAWAIIGGIFLVSSFAVYLGRFSRWNSWDIVLKPAGLLFDVSDRVVNPALHGETYVVTGILFMLLFSLYWVIWEALNYLRS